MAAGRGNDKGTVTELGGVYPSEDHAGALLRGIAMGRGVEETKEVGESW